MVVKLRRSAVDFEKIVLGFGVLPNKFLQMVAGLKFAKNAMCIHTRIACQVCKLRYGYPPDLLAVPRSHDNKRHFSNGNRRLSRLVCRKAKQPDAVNGGVRLFCYSYRTDAKETYQWMGYKRTTRSSN